jgi:hypothetical protein
MRLILVLRLTGLVSLVIMLASAGAGRRLCCARSPNPVSEELDAEIRAFVHHTRDVALGVAVQAAGDGGSTSVGPGRIAVGVVIGLVGGVGC